MPRMVGDSLLRDINQPVGSGMRGFGHDIFLDYFSSDKVL
jgi:hypothetical protein